MREAIGGTWITQLVIAFMLIFVAFLALSVNYTKAFQMKNEMMTIIEQQEGLTSNSINIINNYLSNNGYHTTGNCKGYDYGMTKLDGGTLEKVVNNTKQYSYCVNRNKTSSMMANYDVKIFFFFNLPVIGEFMKFDVTGTTDDVIHPGDNLIER